MLTAQQIRELQKSEQKHLLLAAKQVQLARKACDDPNLSDRAKLGRMRLILREAEGHLKVVWGIRVTIYRWKQYEASKDRG